MPADPRTLGATLAHLRGATALAEASNLELLLWNLFVAIVGDVVMVLWVGFIVALIAALAQGAFAMIGALALAATATLAVRVLLALLLRYGPARLDYLFALSVFSAQRSPRAGTAGSRIIAGFLRGWGIFVRLAGLLGMVAGLGYSIWPLSEKISPNRRWRSTGLPWLARSSSGQSGCPRSWGWRRWALWCCRSG